jgi:hypothetical protein
MGNRAYASVYAGVSVSAVQDAHSLQTTSGMVCEIDEWTWGQITATAVGNLRFSMKRFSGGYSIGSGGSSVTPRPSVFGDSAATCTTRANDTVQTSGGTSVTLRGDVINVLNNYIYQPYREDRHSFTISQAFVVSLDTAPGSAETSSGTLTFRETV